MRIRRNHAAEKPETTMQAPFLPSGAPDSRPRPSSDGRTASALRLAATATVLTIASVAALAGPNGASSGPIEITQAKALTGAVTPGDAAGFPVTISQPGSYRLMGNLTVPDINTTAIVITANDVTLDLNGFTIAGPNSCGYSGALNCTFGVGDGIYIDQPGNRWSNVSIQNGSVRGMGRYGLFDGGGARPGVLIDRVRALDNGGTGFALGGALIVHSVAIRNGMDGFSLNGGNVQSSLAWSNGNYGIQGNGAATFGNSAFGGNVSGQAYPGLRQTAGNLCNTTLCPTY
jgi:hypothetical protein